MTALGKHPGDSNVMGPRFVQAVADGLTARELAERFGVAINTAKKLRASLQHRAGARAQRGPA